MAQRVRKPLLLLVDDDPQVLAAIRRDVRRQYREEYRILATESAQDALDTLEDMAKKGEPVAMLISDQRMPGISGVEFLERAQKIQPQAKRLLLTAYADTGVAIQAINDVRLDYYLMKPWDPPEEKIYPILDDLLFDWRLHYRPAFHGLRVLGFQWSPKSHGLKDFLSGNLVPYRWYDVESDSEGQKLLDEHGIERGALPAVILEDGAVMTNPDLPALATRIGLTATVRAQLYDVVIIGAGPAGLAAAVYGASEGLRTLVIERHAPGGQAGTSSRIENYLGFPSGLSGADLTGRAMAQARRLGAEFMTPREVVRVETAETLKILHLKNGEKIQTRSVVIATGVDYRKLAVEGIDRFTGAGVYYGSAATEAAACRDGEVYLVGGGNSAGQAAVFLSRFASTVHILVRREDLAETMSAYLVQQIAATENIVLHGRTVVDGVDGGERLERLRMRDVDSDEVREVEAVALYIFIGARPQTAWLEDLLTIDRRGFIETGLGLEKYDTFKNAWKLERAPFALESCQPGVLAAGDVRAGAMNRVASAVGEGAMAIKLVHEYLNTV